MDLRRALLMRSSIWILLSLASTAALVHDFLPNMTSNGDFPANRGEGVLLSAYCTTGSTAGHADERQLEL